MLFTQNEKSFCVKSVIFLRKKDEDAVVLG